MKYTKATLEFIKEHFFDDPSKLALQAKKYPEVDMERQNFIIDNLVIEEDVA